MKKNIILLGLVLISLLTACQKDDDLDPSEKPDARLNKALDDYKAQLTGAEHGWKAVLYPDGGAGYSFLIKFKANDRVSMTSDINASTAGTALESTYRLKALQRPALLFDTYSYLHILTDPDPRKSNGDVGAGKYSDFEFSFESVKPEAITLTGNLQGSKLVLTKATADDAANFIRKVAETAKAFENINSFTTYFKRLTIGSMVADISIDSNLRTITFTYLEGNTLKTITTSYYFTADGVALLEPVVIGGVNITSFNNIVYSAATRRITLTVNNTAATITEAARPASIDVQAARRFYNNPPNGVYWVTYGGFTVAGVQDAFGINNINGLEDVIFFIQPDPPYDGFIFFTTGSFFGPALRTQFRSDGRIVFTYDGAQFGTIPAEATSAVVATRNQLILPEGFYVIQTASGYDLVSAKDAKAWISFE